MCGPHLIKLVPLKHEETWAYSQTEKRGIWERCENSAFCQPRREWIQPSASQGESLQGKPTLPTPWSWTSSLQSCENVGICWLSRPVCYIFVTAALGGWSTGAEVPHFPIWNLCPRAAVIPSRLSRWRWCPVSWHCQPACQAPAPA